MPRMKDEIDLNNLEYIFNHVFLPPKLPDQADKNSEKNTSALLDVVEEAARAYQKQLTGSVQPRIQARWDSSIKMLSTLGELQNSKSLSKEKLSSAIENMGTGDVLALYIVAQNAGLILRQLDVNMVFELFEASSTSAAVIGCQGKLLRSFPGPAIAVNLQKAKDLPFHAELSSFLEKMNTEELEEALPESSKGGSKHIETRDTPHPKFITEMLTGVLRGIGEPVDVERMQKRIADDVVWKSAELPWRRSPLWLVVKVALQSTLDRSASDQAYSQYKAFMVFLMAEILQLALEEQLPSDILFVMNAKLSRRTYKMREGMPKFLFTKALDQVSRTARFLEKRWTQVHQSHSAPLNWAPQRLAFEEDMRLSLVNSGPYLAAVMVRKPSAVMSTGVTTSHEKRIDFNPWNLPRRLIKTTPEAERHIALSDFEHWVSEYLDEWVESYAQRGEACRELSELIEDYTSAGRVAYSANPENISIMLLTTMELWIALDKVAVEKYPMLLDYFPEFPDNLFDQLLLPRYNQMKRLHRIEMYLQERRGNSNPSNPSIFSDDVNSSTFAVRYFESSPTHQAIEQAILEEAQMARNKKIAEFEAKKRQYDSLIAEAIGQECLYRYDRGGKRFHPWRDCGKCQLKKRAGEMRIEVHEWPLPGEPLHRMTVIFELECPLGFSVWRDTTYKVLVDLLSPPQPPDTSESPFAQLESYQGLQQHYSNPKRRLNWSSRTKSTRQSHYGGKKFPTTIKKICVKNALKYKLYDSNGIAWTDGRLGNCDLRDACNFKLPDGPYRVLQYAVEDTAHTSNQVIANQSKCPVELTLHEYMAFGMLRAGHRLQWLNIVRELRTRTLTFGHEAVNILFMQAAWQAGPSDPLISPRNLESHLLLEDPEFGRALLQELSDLLVSIKANWMESVSAKTLVWLTARLLTVSVHENIRREGFLLLRRARAVALTWTHQLATQLQRCDKEDDMKDLQLRVLQMAVICRATYDVDHHDLCNILSSDEDVATLVECAIIAHNNTPAAAMVDKLPLPTRMLLDRDRRLSHKLEDHLRRLIIARKEGLNKCISRLWSEYKPAARSVWRCLSAPNYRWMETETASMLDTRSQQVRYNLLNGQLLIDELPVGRMTTEYISHPTFIRLFSEKVIDVYPSSMPGMLFHARHKICGHQVDFGMQQAELIIRSRFGEEVYELVPHEKLAGDFPTHLVEQYFHWLVVATGALEFRPKNDPWKISPTKNWHLSYLGKASRMALGNERLFDIRKGTALMISSILGRLEYPKYIDIRFHLDTQAVSAHLPRLKLEFFINQRNQLECRQFRDMVIDPDQDIGAFSGLVNRLVMRQKSVRSIIIPHGNIDYERNGDHVRVTIDTKGLERVSYHLYTIDTKLGRLVGNDSLASHLYKTYLHAVTAHCLPDPLTRRTGTEEALASLRSATTWSFQKLEKDNGEISFLTLLASLTPTRVYYPEHLKVMQRVEWNCLSPIAQHDEFHTIVTDIFSYASRFHLFREDGEDTLYYESESSKFLLERAAIRNAAFRRHEFGGSLLTSIKDKPYASRDTVPNNSRESRVWLVAEAVERWSPTLVLYPQLIDVLETWGDVCGDPEGMGTELGYDSSMLDGKLASDWGHLYNSIRKATKQENGYQLIFMLSTMAYSEKADMALIGTLLAFATDPRFLQTLNPPIHPSYALKDGYEPQEDGLAEMVESCAINFEISSHASLPAEIGESSAELQYRREEAYKESLKSQVDSLLSYLMSQWPCLKPNPPGKRTKRLYPLLDIAQVMASVRPCFESCYRNKTFREHIGAVQDVLDEISPDPSITPLTYAFNPSPKALPTSLTTISLESRFLVDPPDIPLSPYSPDEQSATSKGESDLKSLLLEFAATNSNEFEKEYAASMLKSFEALEKPEVTVHSVLPSEAALLKSRTLYEDHMEMFFQLIHGYLGPFGGAEELMSLAGLWPNISPMSLLRQLATNVSANLSPKWREVLIAYGEAITMFQRAERLLGFAIQDDEFARESKNLGGHGRDQVGYADWLLISIENNFLVRPVQMQIASEMISPSSKSNQTLQLNMGEGKSSVIVPIISAALADGQKLVRVVVLKPLSGQMFRLLVQKLSGLANRRIFYMPFSRKVKLDSLRASLIRELYEECMRVRGILLVQPEHMLSFKLMGLDQLFGGDKDVATILLDCQRWLGANSRDILDESDEILHVRHELIYTIGTSSPVELFPTRWTVVQEIFSLIRQHAKSIQDGLEVVTVSEYPGSFPITRILSPKAGDTLFSEIISAVFTGYLKTISFRLFPEQIRELAVKFVTEKDICEEEYRPLLIFCDENDISRATLLLLRGLIAKNILFFALKEKRWRVDYGLNPSRSMLAVPYRAKDCPAPRAEFSHPDVAITLTCLSYYYTGLTDPQLENCFVILLKSDNPAVEYGIWVAEDNTMPETLRQLSGVNLIDNDQCKNGIFPRFRYNKSVIDFYLSGVVFPKEAKEYTHKLSTSGWDIAEKKGHPTTGFSGTNDNRHLLPLSIKQHESQEQLNTNAKVLSYILQPENSYLCAKGRNGERLNVDKLLDTLVKQDPPVQVLLDVGAQVLEKRNLEVAKDWLARVDAPTQAAIFFDDDDELTVVTRDGSLESLTVSTFSKRMDQCLVYLDEVHTRGTDLKLPTGSRAAVTLGPNLTKDRLVQACMRMRRLGHGQSVIFCAPPEIHQRILNTVRKSATNSVKVLDVLKWSMHETCINTRNNVPIWAKQGMSYQNRHVAWHHTENTDQMKAVMQEPEAQSLEERFGLQRSDEDFFLVSDLASELRYSEVLLIKENCDKFAITSLYGALMQEEQERELELEVERERQTERPQEATAYQHSIHADVAKFAATGIIDYSSSAFVMAYDSLSGTSAEKHHQRNAWTSNLLLTKDFVNTIKTKKNGSVDDFLRPVQWVVSSASSFVIMSPYEVNFLLPTILLVESVHIHLYSPKVTQAMRSFEDLKLCTIPPILEASWQAPSPLVQQLNIFAGQLYLQDYGAYERLCGFLGLYLKEISLGGAVPILSDGFVENINARNKLGIHSPFSKSPVLFLRQLMGLRRKGQTYLATHIGQILHGRLLTEKDFNYEYEAGNEAVEDNNDDGGGEGTKLGDDSEGSGDYDEEEYYDEDEYSDVGGDN